jgi:5-formyltetrahydrofolate cyclo-ligase
VNLPLPSSFAPLPDSPVGQKQLLRARALKKRAELGADQRADASARAAAHFLAHVLARVEIAENATVALFFPIGDEIDCRLLVPDLLKRGCRICLPVVVGKDLPLIFRFWDGNSPLEAAPFGTFVPDDSAQKTVPDIMVMPLAGFDNRGNRLGYGKGFYDRTIAGLAKKPLLVGLAFGAQELERIEPSPHDIPLDMVVTENGVRVFRS